MMNVFYIPDFTIQGIGFNALNKSRDDLHQIYRKLGFLPFSEKTMTLNDEKVRYFAANNEILGDYVNRMIHIIDERCEKDDRLLLDFPFAIKFTGYSKIISYAVSKGVKIVMFIHDLDGIRFRNPMMNLYDASTMDMAHCLISATHGMTDLLRNGFHVSERVRIVNYDYWDYLCKDKLNQKEKALICFAGNLAKSTFLSKIPPILIDAGFNLYGKGMTKEYKGKHCGEYPPEKLVDKLDGRFGLVWDGKSEKTCSGNFGKYLKYNTSHKFGLYMASAKPVIVWKGSSLSDLVIQKKVGVAVSSLEEVPETLSSLTVSDYLEMKENVLNIRKEVIAGDHLSRVVLDALR